jgi:hypothetical protein
MGGPPGGPSGVGDSEDVAVGVFEPDHAEIAGLGEVDVAFEGEVGKVGIVEEGDTAGLEGGDYRVEVGGAGGVDGPGEGGGPVSAWRTQTCRRRGASRGCGLRGPGRLPGGRREAECFGVEAAGDFNVADGDVGGAVVARE